MLLCGVCMGELCRSDDRLLSCVVWFMHIYGLASLCHLIGILSLTVARDQSRSRTGAVSLRAAWQVLLGDLTTQQGKKKPELSFRRPSSFYFQSVLERRESRSIWCDKDVCFVWLREQVAGADCALVFAAGTTDGWLYKHPALWADETAAKCVQLLCRN